MSQHKKKTGSVSENNPMVASTRRRKNRFESWEKTLEYFSSKSVFQRFDPHVLNCYLSNGLELIDSAYTLRCDPAFEAQIYSASPPSIDEWLTLTCPVHVFVGEESRNLDSFGESTAKYYEEFVPRLPTGRSPMSTLEALLMYTTLCCLGTLHLLSGQNHFAPLEQPATLATLFAPIITDTRDGTTLAKL
jgi:pimeloyl-ACP methyl ester carboxylesterase